MAALILPASVKGEQGWLSVRLGRSGFHYAVTMEEGEATPFPSQSAAERHAARAEACGIIVPRWSPSETG
jgi:hypothetical protein